MATVLHLIETSGIGGAEQVLLDLVRTLDRSRWRSVVVVPDIGWLPDRLAEGGIEFIEVREHGAFDVRSLARVAAFARRTQASIIHSHLFGSAVRAGALSRILGIPAVGTIHGQVDLSSRERWKTLKLALVRRGLRGLVFVSEPLRQASLASMRVPAGMTRVIGNGVDATRFSPGRGERVRRELGISPDDFVVGSVGRLQPVKGLEIFLDAAADLSARAPGYRFVVAGEGDSAYTRQLVSHAERIGLATRVAFTGFRSDANDVMRAFDVYALTSRSEGFSLSTIEAMASGVPVVATRCGGPEQIIDDGVTGLLVENGSVAAVAGAIDRLRQNPTERSRLAAAARDVVLQRYTIESQVSAYEELYESVLAADGRSAAVARGSQTQTVG